MTVAIIKLALIFPRNKKDMISTRRIAIEIVLTRLSIELLTKSDKSITTFISIPGYFCSNVLILSFTLSATSTIFAPDFL
ncbi:hypothetical protein ES703_65986 [subsurface metagenome]